MSPVIGARDLFQTGLGMENGSDHFRMMEAQAILKQLNVSIYSVPEKVLLMLCIRNLRAITIFGQSPTQRQRLEYVPLVKMPPMSL